VPHAAGRLNFPIDNSKQRQAHENEQGSNCKATPAIKKHHWNSAQQLL